MAEKIPHIKISVAKRRFTLLGISKFAISNLKLLSVLRCGVVVNNFIISNV
jgi:hypothetical protein